MAESTGLVLAAGGLIFTDHLLNGRPPKPGRPASERGPKQADLLVAVATGAAALVTAGIDRVAPGMGKGLAVIMVLGAVLTSGPGVVKAVTPR